MAINMKKYNSIKIGEYFFELRIPDDRCNTCVYSKNGEKCERIKSFSIIFGDDDKFALCLAYKEKPEEDHGTNNKGTGPYFCPVCKGELNIDFLLNYAYCPICGNELKALDVIKAENKENV